MIELNISQCWKNTKRFPHLKGVRVVEILECSLFTIEEKLEMSSIVLRNMHIKMHLEKH